MIKAIALSVLSAGLGAAAMSGWAIGSGHRALEGLSIMAVGEVSHEEHRDYQTGRTTEWFEFTGPESFCFVMPNYTGYWGYSDEAALIVSDNQDRYGMAIVETVVSSVKVDLQAFEFVRCP